LEIVLDEKLNWENIAGMSAVGDKNALIGRAESINRPTAIPVPSRRQGDGGPSFPPTGITKNPSTPPPPSVSSVPRPPRPPGPPPPTKDGKDALSPYIPSE
ncbi:MAG: hypothetical protein WCG27_10440, partial [Pseudomonadota bacterium]